MFVKIVLLRLDRKAGVEIGWQRSQVKSAKEENIFNQDKCPVQEL